jgi:SLOG family YspA-like protein
VTARILITGSREWTNAGYIAHMLAIAAQFHPGAVLVHGDCRGADRIAARIWSRWGLPTEPHPADWARDGRAAGPIRNAAMVNAGADLCLAFLLPGSRGAVHCAELAEQAGITTKRFGHVTQEIAS